MKSFLLLFLSAFVFQFTIAQKKVPVHFVIKQDDDQQELLVLDIPNSGTTTMEANYVLYEKGKSSLTIDYALDDDPNLTVKNTIKDKNADLVKYCTEIPDKELAGTSDITISNKKIAPSTKNINGFPTEIVTYDYSRVIAGQNITEKGKAVLYVIKLNGTSSLNSEEHLFIVRLKFDYQQNGGDDLTKLGSDIINTIKKAAN
jgi:hypothetical protein